MTNTTPHRATAEAWTQIERFVKECSYDSCLVELRARVEALEAGATCPHIVSSDEGTSYCGLAEQQAAPAQDPIAQVADKAIAAVMAQREEILQAFVAKYGADPGSVEQVEQQMLDGSTRWFVRVLATHTTPAPAGSLVERVGKAISLDAWDDDAGNWSAEARAAIRAVAEWMRENECGYNAVRWLEQELER